MLKIVQQRNGQRDLSADHIPSAQMKPVSHVNREVDLDAICTPQRKLSVPLLDVLADNPRPSWTPLLASVSDSQSKKCTAISTYCLFEENKIFVIIFVICVRIGMFLKTVVESSLLSKYEHITPNIDQVMSV